MKAFILYSTGAVTIFAIGLIVVSFLFRNDAFGLFEEFKNLTQIWEYNRMQYCGNCTTDTSLFNRQPECRNGRDGCYRENAETHAALLDYNELLSKSSRDFFQKFIKDYNFTTYGSGEAVIKEKVAQLMSYPESWITITGLGIAFGIFQLILIASLAIATATASKHYENTLDKCWIGAFIIWFLLSLSLFIGGLVQKIDYPCPGQAYKSKYGGSGSGCTGTHTYGQSVAGFLGTDLVLCTIVSCIFLRDLVNSRSNK